MGIFQNWKWWFFMEIWRRLFALKCLVYTRFAEIHLEWQIGLYCVIPLAIWDRKVLILRVGDRVECGTVCCRMVINKSVFIYHITLKYFPSNTQPNIFENSILFEGLHRLTGRKKVALCLDGEGEKTHNSRTKLTRWQIERLNTKKRLSLKFIWVLNTDAHVLCLLGREISRVVHHPSWVAYVPGGYGISAPIPLSQGTTKEETRFPHLFWLTCCC